ncbi:beta-1,3-galactosyltransferase 1-like [Mugil cephalus]|uniref:beta-1,3-galactosyltransferase 1-like n=1 Tax=Mugil cephalus TaxID=48193 RepID=UPI001FB7A257|nr:beta-1,3-galactosyltransferase 1-like [Mugil cephalus]
MMACQSEKTFWKRRCHFMMLFFMAGIILLVFYSSGLEAPRHLNRSLYYPAPQVRNVTDSREAGGDGGGLTQRDQGGEAGHSEISTPQESTSQYFVAYPHHYNYILDEPNKCRQESPFLVLIIPVTADNVEAREIIRNTWGRDTTVQGQVVHHYFLLGRSMERNGIERLKEQVASESQKHHDILQSDFVDSYNNLTIKTMVMFEWLSTHCPKTSYAMKVDSDVFLNVPKLVDLLLKAPQHLYLMGIMAGGTSVVRDRNSKWFLPISVFPEPTYPPYALGLGYVFSLDLPKKIVDASAHVKAIYIEDVYLGLCMRHLGIAPRDPPRGGLFRVFAPPSISKCYWNSIIVTLLPNSKKILDAWKTYEVDAKSGC